MSRNQDDYKEWQDRYKSLEEEYDDEWSDKEKRDLYENMKDTNEQELQGRLEARDEWGEDGNEGHDHRIEELQDREQLLNHGIAHHEGEYEYQTEGMQDMNEDLRRELEEENDRKGGVEDMDLYDPESE